MQRQPAEKPELISTGQAARILHISTQSVRNVASSGFIGSIGASFGGHRRLWRSDVEELARYMAKQRNGKPVGEGPYKLKGHRLPRLTDPATPESPWGVFDLDDGQRGPAEQ